MITLLRECDFDPQEGFSVVITDIPSDNDFHQAGIAYLNLAWDSAVSLALHLSEAERYEGLDEDEEIRDEFWKAAQRPLATSVTLLQQGAEFLLKSRIAKVSPFLLITGPVARWPKGCNERDVSFASFRTVDAQDLVRLHDTVFSTRLPERIVRLHEDLRKTRNTIMHTHDSSMKFSPVEVLESILEYSEVFIGKKQWVVTRENYMETEPKAVAYSPDYVHAAMVREFLGVIDLLSPSQLERFFEFNPRNRCYYCCNCQMASGDYGHEAKTAQLTGRSSSSKTVRCFVCRETESVDRKPCSNSGCKGNVLHRADGTCLCCFDRNK